MKPKVAILGGGVGGLSTAHYLADSCDVTVYEASDHAVGGKAKSVRNADGTPAEHGFRYFPGYYEYVPGIMEQIPFGRRSVADHLVEAEVTQILRDGQAPVPLANKVARGFLDGAHTMGQLLELGIPIEELAVFGAKILTLAATGPKRWDNQYDALSWWDFTEAEGKSPEYQAYLADGMNLATVAARGTDLSTRTVGRTLIRLLFAYAKGRQGMDRVLDGPTSDAWIEPWRTELVRRGVRFDMGAWLERLEMGPDGIRAAVIRQGGERRRIEADYFVAAVPVEAMAAVADDALVEAAPSLGRIGELQTRWMNGIQFYLRTPVPSAPGHSVYVGSGAALTSISQAQFWPKADLGQVGGEPVRGVISAIVSNFEHCCPQHGGRPLTHHTRAELSACTWETVKAFVGADDHQRLSDGDLLGSSLDRALVETAGGRLHNLEPLLINRPGDLERRPDPCTEIPNLSIAADYATTSTDLACMEGAAEAAFLSARRIAMWADVSFDHPVRSLDPAELADVWSADDERYSRGEATLVTEEMLLALARFSRRERIVSLVRNGVSRMRPTEVRSSIARRSRSDRAWSALRG